MNVLILLVDFTDNQAQTPAVYFDSMGFAQDTFSLTSYTGIEEENDSPGEFLSVTGNLINVNHPGVLPK